MDSKHTSTQHSVRYRLREQDNSVRPIEQSPANFLVRLKFTPICFCLEWTLSRYTKCAPEVKEWVICVLRCANRVAASLARQNGQAPHEIASYPRLPLELWLMIFAMLSIGEMG